MAIVRCLDMKCYVFGNMCCSDWRVERKVVVVERGKTL